VQFVFSSNGHLFVEFDRSTGLTSAPRPLAEFPRPEELRARYEKITRSHARERGDAKFG
jgi:type I restriction enzyme R subunit